MGTQLTITRDQRWTIERRSKFRFVKGRTGFYTVPWGYCLAHVRIVEFFMQLHEVSLQLLIAFLQNTRTEQMPEADVIPSPSVMGLQQFSYPQHIHFFWSTKVCHKWWNSWQKSLNSQIRFPLPPMQCPQASLKTKEGILCIFSKKEEIGAGGMAQRPAHPAKAIWPSK